MGLANAQFRVTQLCKENGVGKNRRGDTKTIALRKPNRTNARDNKKINYLV